MRRIANLVVGDFRWTYCGGREDSLGRRSKTEPTGGSSIDGGRGRGRAAVKISRRKSANPQPVCKLR